MHLPWRPVAVTPNGPPILTSVTQAEADCLAMLAAGGQVLEIGSAYGYSTVVLAHSASHLISVDPHLTHNSYPILLSYLTQYRVADRVDVRRAVSQSVLPNLADQGAHFDLIFIDGDHTTPGITHDLQWALKLVRPGGTIAVHDVEETCCCPDVRPVVDAILQTYELVDTMAVVTP